jgi:hypothetical protein
MGRLLPGAAGALVGLAAWSLIACEDDVDIPQGPDMLPLVAQYNSPTGTLNEENVATVAEAAAVEFRVIEQIGDLDFVVATFNAVDDTIEDFAAPDGDPDDDIGGTVKVNGIARVQTICPGVADRLDREANGTLNMNVPFTESRLAPVLFGGFNECIFRVPGSAIALTPVTLDSPINAYVGPGVRFNLQGLDSILFQLPDGTVRFGTGETTPFETDFRRWVDGRLEVRVEVEDGDVVPFINRQTLSAGIRAKNGSFCCDFGERQCIETTEPECTKPANGDRVLTW